MILREVTLLSVIFRIVVSFFLGGMLGMERGLKQRAAGLRTYMLVCVGACMIMLTNEYVVQVYGSGDPVRMGAQVVSGIGFLGAGTIIVTRRQRVKGLTTAAGLWTSAIIGLALGSGFYEGAILVTILVLMAELLFSRLEYHILRNAPEINLYLEYIEKGCLDNVLKLFRTQNIKVLNLEITRPDGSEHHNACALFSLRLHKKVLPEKLMVDISSIPGIQTVEEL